MSKDAKKLCAFKKDEIKKDMQKIKELVKEPGFICRKCARSAKEKAHLCKPEEL